MITGEYKNYNHYIQKKWSKDPKESFKKLASLIESSDFKEESSVLDIGCATGELINFLKERFKNFRFTGLDVEYELIKEAKRLLPDVKFVKSSVLNLKEHINESFDIVLALGVLGIIDIDESSAFFDNLFHCTKKKGKIYIFSHFNTYDVDVITRHRKYSDGKVGDWEKGWNIYSIETISNLLNNRCQAFKFHEFRLPFLMAPIDDPVRTWTVKTENNPYQLTNGLKLMVDLSFLEIEV